MLEQVVVSSPQPPLQHCTTLSCTHFCAPQRILQPKSREREGKREREVETEEEGGREGGRVEIISKTISQQVGPTYSSPTYEN